MATYTTYLNLEKPTTSETFNLLKMNQNWDKIDSGVSALNSNFTALIGSAHIYRDNDSKTTYSFNLSPFTDSSYKAGILIHHDAWNPSVNLITLSGGASPQYCILHNIYKKNDSVTVSASVTNKVLTVTFDSTAYGGCSLIWLN